MEEAVEADVAVPPPPPVPLPAADAVVDEVPFEEDAVVVAVVVDAVVASEINVLAPRVLDADVGAASTSMASSVSED